MPYSKTGGLADIGAALPLALHRLGCDIRVLTPLYGSIDSTHYGLKPAGPKSAITMRGAELPIQFLETEMSGGLPVYFLENDALYDRPGIYVDPFSNKDYLDNDYRYVALSKSAPALCRMLDWQPDIFHCHDWQSGLVAMYLHVAREKKEFLSSRSVMTIHNLAYQGQFPAETVARLNGMERFFFPGGPLEFYGLVNFMKAGIEFADGVNTVSPTYAKEIQSSYEFGFGLEKGLNARGDLVGILNGIDTEIWNPETDPRIKQNFTIETLDRKAENKRALCKQMGLAYDAGIPLIGMVSRIVSQKGFDILIQSLPEILRLPAQFVLLGAGDPLLEHVLRETAHVFPDRVGVRFGYDEDLAHLIEAGADLFMMPSKYEPCGLNQMMSMRYGTPPIVRATGGLADSVSDADINSVEGTGFVFDNYTSKELTGAVRRAVVAFHNRERWRTLQRNAMLQDFSWTRSAQSYIELYQRSLAKHPRVIS